MSCNAAKPAPVAGLNQKQIYTMSNTTLKHIVLISAALLLTVCTFLIGYKWDEAVHGELDYQIKLKVSYDVNVKDSITLYQGNRKVGTVPLNYKEPFAELILSDNE
jgi:hypothetical protein